VPFAAWVGQARMRVRWGRIPFHGNGHFGGRVIITSRVCFGRVTSSRPPQSTGAVDVPFAVWVGWAKMCVRWGPYPLGHFG